MCSQIHVGLPETYQPYQNMVNQYAAWLLSEGHSDKVNNLRGEAQSKDLGQVEGVIGEAGAWQWLAAHTETVQVNETRSSGGPDFLVNGPTAPTLVEVSVMSSQKVESKTGLAREITPGAKHYGTLTTCVKQLAQRKAHQLVNAQHPALVIAACVSSEAAGVAMATHHLDELLIGRTEIRGRFDPQQGEVQLPLQEEVTLEGSVFLDSSTLKAVRKNISALVILNLSTYPEPVAKGVINPGAVRPFDDSVLSSVCFGRLEPWPLTPQSNVVWRRACGQPCDHESEKKRLASEAERRLRDAGFGSFLEGVMRAVQSSCWL